MDFSSILNQESTYLSSLANVFPLNLGTATSNLNIVNTQLGALAGKIDVSGTQAITSRQADMSNIISNETDRLNAKKNSIDQAMDSQKRLVSLNQSYSEKYSQYIFIIIIMVVALVLFLGILMVQQNMENPPSGFFTFLQIIVLGGAFIYAMIIYNNIQSRNNMNYAELAVTTPLPLTAEQIAAQSAAQTKAGNLLGSQNLSGCMGSTCCGTGSIWDVSSQTCIPDSFTTIADSGNMILSKNSVDTKAYSDNEFDVYALYR